MKPIISDSETIDFLSGPIEFDNYMMLHKISLSQSSKLTVACKSHGIVKRMCKACISLECIYWRLVGDKD